MSNLPSATRRRRGRPAAGTQPAATRERILDAALEAFADVGYRGVSIRELTRRLGVSHGLFHARFGTKLALWHAAVDHGMSRLVEQLDVAVARADNLDTPQERLKKLYVTFLLGLDRAPAVLRLMNQEGLEGGDRLEYIYKRYMTIGTFQGDIIVDEGVASGVFRDVSRPILFFLMAHGGGAVFSLRALALKLGLPTTETEQAARTRAEEIADTLIRGILRD